MAHTSVMQDRRCMKVIRAPPDSVWAKHHRIVGASRSTVEQVHVTTATAKETSRTGFQLADRDNYGLDSGERTLPTLPATARAGESEDVVSRESSVRCENFLKAFGQGVIPRVANIRNLQTGQLTALRRWERVKSRQTSSDSAKVKTTCEDRPLPLATWLRSANRTASRGTTVNRVGTSTHVTRSINPCCAFHRTRAFVASSSFERDLWRASRLTSTWRDEWTALRWRVSVWILPKFVLASSFWLAVRSFSSSGQSLNWQSSLVCSIFCVWMSALLLSVFLFELRKLEGLPTERCSTESQALRRGGRRWKYFCLWTRGGLPLLTTKNLLGELAQCSACWSLPRRWAAWSRWWRSR